MQSFYLEGELRQLPGNIPHIERQGEREARSKEE